MMVIVALIAALGGTAVAGGVLNKKKVNEHNHQPGAWPLGCEREECRQFQNGG